MRHRRRSTRKSRDSPSALPPTKTAPRRAPVGAGRKWWRPRSSSSASSALTFTSGGRTTSITGTKCDYHLVHGITGQEQLGVGFAAGARCFVVNAGECGKRKKAQY